MSTENSLEYDEMKKAQLLFTDALKLEYGTDAVPMRYEPDFKYPEKLQKIAADYKKKINAYHELWRKVSR